MIVLKMIRECAIIAELNVLASALRETCFILTQKIFSDVKGCVFIKNNCTLLSEGCFFVFWRGSAVENRVSIIGIIVENTDSVDRLNDILHDYKNYIIGRMGIPYKEKNMNVISIVLDAPLDIINRLSGKIGMLDGITSKVVCSKK